MAMTISGSGRADYAPGTLLVAIADGTANATGTVSIDGTSTGQTVKLLSTGALPNATIVLPSLTSGSHTLSITAGSTATFSFTVIYQQVLPSTSSGSLTPSAQQVAKKWQFQDPVTSAIYVLPIGPITEASPLPALNITEKLTTTGQPVSSQGVTQPVRWAISGWVDSQAQHDAFVLWSKKPHKIWVTDDLGRQFLCVITSYEPVPVAPGRDYNSAYRQQYKMTFLLLGQVT